MAVHTVLGLFALRGVHDLVALLGLEHVDFGAGKLARAHAMLEEQVQLRERATRGLGDAEVRVDDAEEANAALRPVSVSARPERQRFRTQKNAVSFFQFHAVGLTMYGVRTLHTIPTMLLRNR